MIIHENEFELDITNCNLRGKIIALMEKKGWIQRDLENATGIHKSALSKMMNNDRQFTIEHLDSIIKALEINEVELFPDFISECIDEKGKYKVSKCEDFIVRCYAIGLVDIAKALTEELLNQDIKNNKEIVIRISDKLYENKLYDYALKLYDAIIQEEQKKSTRLAMCYFKKFMILRDMDLNGKGKEALIRLLDYLILLPDEDEVVDGEKYNMKLDAYYRVIAYFNVMEDWNNLLEYAKELEKTSIMLKNEEYLGEALLYQGFAYKGLNDFDKLFSTIDKYKEINEYYNNLAIGNKLFAEVEMGKVSSINKYLDWASSESQISVFVPVALESYLKNNMNDEALIFIKKYSDYIETISASTFILNRKRYLRYKHVEALIYLSKNNYELAIDSLIKAIEIAKFVGNINRLTMCMSLIYKNYSKLTLSQKGELEMVLERR